MARKRYILLKDTPELKAGTVIEEMCDDGNQPYEPILMRDYHFPRQYGNEVGYITFPRRVVEDQPTWFELAEEITVPRRIIEKVKEIVRNTLQAPQDIVIEKKPIKKVVRKGVKNK